VALRAGSVGKHGKSHGKAKHTRASAKHASVAKWHRQVEMHRDIAESCRDLEEEQQHVRRVFGRERDHQSALSHLGLNEVEAVEYVLMLSRDEEEARRRATGSDAFASTSRRDIEEGVFLDDLDLQTPVTAPMSLLWSDPRPAGHSSTGTGSPFWSVSSQSASSSSYAFANGRSHALVSQSNHKVQVSPRVRPEPTEAGFSASPIDGSMSSLAGGSRAVAVPSDPAQFPPVSRTPSSAGASVPSTPRSSSHVSGSPTSFRSAWSTPLHMSRSTAGTPSVQGSAPPSPVIASRVGGAIGPSGISRSMVGVPSASAASTTQHGREGDWNDDDIRYAIELSLAEARSRGEVV